MMGPYQSSPGKKQQQHTALVLQTDENTINLLNDTNNRMVQIGTLYNTNTTCDEIDVNPLKATVTTWRQGIVTHP